MAGERQQTALDAVASRLGREAFSHRIALEEFRDAEFRKIVTVQGTYLKIHVLRPIQKAILWCMGLWGKGRRELLNPVVRENEVLLGDRLPPEFDGFRLLHLTDLHIDMDEGIVEAVSKAVAPLEYDVCVMTGDYRNKTIGDFGKAVSLMRKLRPALTRYLLVAASLALLAMSVADLAQVHTASRELEQRIRTQALSAEDLGEEGPSIPLSRDGKNVMVIAARSRFAIRESLLTRPGELCYILL
jgi:hypothetical protein